MNVLAIETATSSCGVGLRTSAGVQVTRVVDEHRRHTEVLTVSIARLLDECALVARDLDRVVVDAGPGLFTGLRVGLATASAMAHALGCAIVGVSSLELLAHGAHRAGVRGTLVTALDARRGELFVQTFALGDDVVELDSPAVAKPARVVTQWSRDASALTVTGDGVLRYADDFAELAPAAIFAQSVPSLEAALALGAARRAQGHVAPLYLCDADAVANFATRERRA